MGFRRSVGMLLTLSLLLGAGAGLFPPLNAHAHPKHHCWHGKNNRVHCDNGHDYYYDCRRQSWVDYQTGKILKGGLVGAGIGAGAGLLLDRNVGKSALIGAGLGAGAQAVRYSRTMHRHPIAKTAAYGALTGVGVNAICQDNLGKGALWGAGIGAGLGALQHLD